MGDIAQLTANSVATAAGTFVFAVGLLLAYRVCGVFNFAYGALLASGAYFAYCLQNQLAVPVLAAVALGVALTAVVGGVMEGCVFRMLRMRAAPSLVHLLASLGLYVVLVSTIAMVFGEDSKTLRPETVSEGMAILGARMTPSQVVAVATSVALVICLPLILRHTRVGKAALAVASDCVLASTAGIGTERIRLHVSIVASALVGFAGVLSGFERNVTPSMGMNILMAGIVVVVLGGGRSIVGVALASIALGAIQNIAAWTINAQWKDVVTFAILLAFLFARPKGLLGRAARKTTV